MRISPHFLVPFLSVSVLGGAMLMFVTRSDFNRVSSVKTPPADLESVAAAPAGNDGLSRGNQQTPIRPEKLESEVLGRVDADISQGDNATVSNATLISAKPSTPVEDNISPGGTAVDLYAKPFSSGNSDTAATNLKPARAHPFTHDEEMYRLWYGWASIDDFRAARSTEH